MAKYWTVDNKMGTRTCGTLGTANIKISRKALLKFYINASR